MWSSASPVAAARDYLSDVGSIGDIVNLLLAVLLWPLVLLGVDFNLDIGGGRDGEGENKNGALLLLAPRWPMRDPPLDRRGSFGATPGVWHSQWGAAELSFLRKRRGRLRS
jgi:hypothetical protein